jgi:hypothetical protein
MKKAISKKDIYKYTGDTSQLFYAKQYRLCGGKADGMRAVDINNGSGLEFTVLADRALDIGRLSFNGTNFSYITKAGYVSPEYYDDKNAGWIKTFSAGFLTTCGLTQVGPPCEYDDESYGLHGKISTIPSEDFSADVNMESDTPEIIVKGKMRLGELFGTNLWLYREIKVKYGQNKIHIKDRVENRDGKKVPYMILYHFNLGYPLLNKNVKLKTSAEFIKSRDEQAKLGEDERLNFQKPEVGFKEQAYYYKNMATEDGLSYAGIYNDELKLGVNIKVDPRQLPNLIQWKNPGYGDYVLGIEPANCWPEGRLKQKEYGLEFIGPNEIKTQEVIVEII